MFFSLMQGILSLPLTLVFWSHNQLLLHSFIMRHPWSCSKFYQVWLLSPPFPSGLGYGHCLAYGMELSGSVHSILKAEFWGSSHLCFECSTYALRFHSLMHFCKLTLDFFYQSLNPRRSVLKCCLFSVTAGACRMRVVCAHKQLVMLLLSHFCLTVFTLCAWLTAVCFNHTAS